MKILKLLFLIFAGSFVALQAAAQANANINILTLNSGQVTLGGTVDIQVTIGNTGPVSTINAGKIRAVITVPNSIVSVVANAQQTGIPAGWTITANTGTAMTVCNSTDPIPVNEQRIILVKIQGNVIGGPLTVLGTINFPTGLCTGPNGSLPGDNSADNSSTSSVQVIPGCPLTVSASAGTIVCNGGTTTLTATAAAAGGPVEYSITGGAPFQPGNTFTVPAGTYTVTARESANTTCSATSSPVTITDPAAVPAPTVSVVDPTCTVATGTITITSATAGLTFSLDGGAYAAYPAGGYIVAAGAHTLKAQNAGNCLSAVTNITVNAQPPTPAAPTTNIVNPTCTVATATITITSATAGLTFSFDGGAYAAYPAGGYTGVTAGAHTLTAQNANTCISAVSNITVNAQPPTPAAPTTTVIHPTCTVATGTITITSATAGLTFSLDGGAYAVYPAGGYLVSAGAHTLTAQNTSTCISPVSNITVNPQPPTPAAPTAGTITQPTCAVSTGSVVLNGLPAGNWTINPGAITGNTASTTISGLAAGTYNYTVTNNVGCTSPASADIVINPVPGAPAAPTVNVIQPTCTVATATITVTSATAGLTFSLDGASYAPYPAGGYIVSAGAHTLTLQNAASCISPVTNITVNAQPPTPAAPTVNIVHPTCTIATGIITVTSATAGLTFSLDGSAYAPYPAGGYIVSAGVHTLTTQNTSNCISSTTNITVNAQPPTPAAPLVGTITHPTCAITTGSVVLSGLPSGNWIINPGAIAGTGASTTVTGLAPATTYNFTVTNDVGCVSAPSANVVINPIAGTPPAPTVSLVHPTCTTATGTITITSSTAGLNFSLDNGPYLPYSIPYTVTAGAHTLTAQNIVTSCISSITNITINAQPPTPAAPTVNAAQPTCTVATGTITITSATAGLTFSLDGAAYAAYPAGGYIVTAGAHTLTAQNTSTCISAVTNIVVNAQPPTPAAPTVNVVQPTCTVSTGTITITSATAGLTFSLDGAAYAVYPAGGYIVAAGAHTLTAQNTSTCISAVTNIVVNAQPPTPAAPTVSVIQPTCAVATATITITSATAGLTFSLDGAAFAAYPAGGYIVVPGAHTLTAQNITNCVSNAANITINPQPTTPSATLSAGSISCFGGNTTLTVTATGGTAPYQYSLNGGTFQSGNTFTVIAGSHIVTVRGTNLCTTTAAITVTQPTAITASASVIPIACNGGTTTLTATATGGTTAYQYSLNGGTYQTSNTFTVGTGVQTVTVKDANGCTKTATAVTVTQPAVLKALADAPRITTCGGKTLVTITATGGRTPYTGTGTFLKGPGTWNFTVTDASGCRADTSINIEPPGCVDLEVFPNPAQNSINVNHSVAEAGAVMQVFDMKGALLFTKTIPFDAFLTTIDISRLPAEAYVLVFTNGKDKKSVRFEKLRH